MTCRTCPPNAVIKARGARSPHTFFETLTDSCWVSCSICCVFLVDLLRQLFCHLLTCTVERLGPFYSELIWCYQSWCNRPFGLQHNIKLAYSQYRAAMQMYSILIRIQRAQWSENTDNRVTAETRPASHAWPMPLRLDLSLVNHLMAYCSTPNRCGRAVCHISGLHMPTASHLL